MAKDIVQITGKVYLPDGDVVVAGSIKANAYPPGMVSKDTSVSSFYKVGFGHRSPIGTTGIQSLTLFRTNSLPHSRAYYLLRYEITDPVPATWEELVRVQVNVNTPTVDVGSLAILSNTPYLGWNI